MRIYIKFLYKKQTKKTHIWQKSEHKSVKCVWGQRVSVVPMIKHATTSIHLSFQNLWIVKKLHLLGDICRNRQRTTVTTINPSQTSPRRWKQVRLLNPQPFIALIPLKAPLRQSGVTGCEIFHKAKFNKSDSDKAWRHRGYTALQWFCLQKKSTSNTETFEAGDLMVSSRWLFWLKRLLSLIKCMGDTTTWFLPSRINMKTCDGTHWTFQEFLRPNEISTTTLLFWFQTIVLQSPFDK